MPQKDSPSLSVVIPTHQRSDLLHQCLLSLQNFAPPRTEIIVVDDASPKGCAHEVAEPFAGVKVISRKIQGGFAAAANTGIRTATGDIVQLLNDDAEVTQDWATNALRWFADPAIGAVAPLVLFWSDSQRIDSAGDRYYLGGVAGKRGHGQKYGNAFTQACPVFGASASSGFYRRGALERVGLFPESFGSYFEDVDLAFRLQRAGYRAIYEPRTRVIHRVGASHGQPKRRLLEQQSRNEERVFWRNVPNGAMSSALPKHLAVLGGKAWRRWQEGMLLPWVFGRLRMLGEVNQIWKHRVALKELGDGRDVAGWGVETIYSPKTFIGPFEQNDLSSLWQS